MIMSSAIKIQSRNTLRKVLLVCGILAALAQVGTDLLGGMLWKGYNFASQAISELTAIGAPTRPCLFRLPPSILHSRLRLD